MLMLMAWVMCTLTIDQPEGLSMDTAHAAGASVVPQQTCKRARQRTQNCQHRLADCPNCRLCQSVDRGSSCRACTHTCLRGSKQQSNEPAVLLNPLHYRTGCRLDRRLLPSRQGPQIKQHLSCQAMVQVSKAMPHGRSLLYPR